ncbi:MAG: WhiB family transcriptional regulator [Actinobacteria bacterium]|nr:WhiB family transcriptional regulator [Actinomycetota bacterium]
MDIIQQMGLDPDDVNWQDFASCRDVVKVTYDEEGHRHVFDPMFEAYELDEYPYPIRTAVDQMCANCDVQEICLQTGIDGKESGVRGGIYLVEGVADPARNAHKEIA